MSKICKNRVFGAILSLLPEFCYRSATNLLQTTEKGASYTFHYQYAKVNLFHFCILVKQYNQLIYRNITAKNMKKRRQSRSILERIPYI